MATEQARKDLGVLFTNRIFPHTEATKSTERSRILW